MLLLSALVAHTAPDAPPRALAPAVLEAAQSTLVSLDSPPVKFTADPVLPLQLYGHRPSQPPCGVDQSPLRSPGLPFAGSSIATENGIIVIGATGEDFAKGAVYIQDTNGTVLDVLRAPDAEDQTLFGDGLPLTRPPFPARRAARAVRGRAHPGSCFGLLQASA